MDLSGAGDSERSTKVGDQHDPVRRTLLATLLAASAASFLPASLAAPAGSDRGAFLETSKLLTGRASLDPEQTARLFDALVAEDPQFPAQISSLLSLLDERKIDPLHLQQTLDAESSALAALPRKILRAWYVGVVGEDEHARCIAFETSLMNVIVDDHLKPPSYCYGVYGSWSKKPA